MIIAPVIFLTVASGIAGMTDFATVGKKAEPIVDFLQALALPVFRLVAILMKAADRRLWRDGLHRRQIRRRLDRDLAMLIGTFLGAVARYNCEACLPWSG